MENSIIEDFQNLHVLAAYDLAIMDDLVHDFTLALDESSRTQRSYRDGTCLHNDSLMRRRRRFKKRKANVGMMIHGSNLSEACESSIDEAFKDYIENMTRQSDSDEFLMNEHKIPSTQPFPVLSVPHLVESDSVTENVTPLRPQRRRRHLKRMAVDSQPRVEFSGLSKNSTTDFHGLPSADGLLIHETGIPCAHPLSGKRKRSSKDKSDSNSFDFDLNDENQQDDRILDLNQAHMIDGNISSLSSNESECGNSTGDGRDGDDEESDAYHEQECNAGLHLSKDAENASYDEMEKMQIQDMNADMDKIFAVGLELMSPTSRSCFKARMKLLNGRQMQAGRRRLRDRHPAYLLNAFLQEWQMWNRGCVGWQQPVCSGAGGMAPGGTSKRHRRMPPTDSNFEMMFEQSEPAIGSDFRVSSGRLLSGDAGNPAALFTLGQKTTRCKGHFGPLSVSHNYS